MRGEFCCQRRESCDSAPEFVIDMCADDFIEGAFGAKAESERALRIKGPWPVFDYALNRFVGFAADEAQRLVARDAPQSRELVSNGRGDTRQR